MDVCTHGYSGLDSVNKSVTTFLAALLRPSKRRLVKDPSPDSSSLPSSICQSKNKNNQSVSGTFYFKTNLSYHLHRDN